MRRRGSHLSRAKRWRLEERVALGLLRQARDDRANTDGVVESFRFVGNGLPFWMRVLDRLQAKGYGIDVSRVARFDRGYRETPIWHARLLSEPESVVTSQPGEAAESVAKRLQGDESAHHVPLALFTDDRDATAAIRGDSA